MKRVLKGRERYENKIAIFSHNVEKGKNSRLFFLLRASGDSR